MFSAGLGGDGRGSGCTRPGRGRDRRIGNRASGPSASRGRGNGRTHEDDRGSSPGSRTPAMMLCRGQCVHEMWHVHQVPGAVDVVLCFQLTPGPPECSQEFPGLTQHSTTTPVNPLEECRFDATGSDQIVASVAGWSDDHPTIALEEQPLRESHFLCRYERAVAPDEHRPGMSSQLHPQSMEHALAEVAPALAADFDREIGGQCTKKVVGGRRAPQRHRSDPCLSSLGQRHPDHALQQRGGALRSQGRNQPRFGLSRHRSTTEHVDRNGPAERNERQTETLNVDSRFGASVVDPLPTRRQIAGSTSGRRS